MNNKIFIPNEEVSLSDLQNLVNEINKDKEFNVIILNEKFENISNLVYKKGNNNNKIVLDFGKKTKGLYYVFITTSSSVITKNIYI